MAELTATNKKIHELRHRGRLNQVNIYIGKFVRMFLYQSDWKALPMAAVISYMVALVVRDSCFVTREGTILGALAITCVALWNGCFNSIQVICRERAIIKREHRAGMHVSAYVTAHALYQAAVCLAQTGITLYVFYTARIHFPGTGVMGKSFILELGITVFLVTYAADLMSLFISSVVHSTTTAMTVMPFVLIFQLVFSGAVFQVPEQLNMLPRLTVSSYGFRCIACQADYNALPMSSGWSTLVKMRDCPLDTTFTIEQLADALDSDQGAQIAEIPVEGNLTVGDAVHMMRSSPEWDTVKDRPVELHMTVGQVVDFFGEDAVKDAVMEKSSESSINPLYEADPGTILLCWLALGLFVAGFWLLTALSLKFIDRDRR